MDEGSDEDENDGDCCKNPYYDLYQASTANSSSAGH